jgi:hypothetical protein
MTLAHVIGDIAIKPEPAKPAIRQVQVDFLAQPPLGPDPEAVSDQQHPDHHSGAIEGRPIGLNLSPLPSGSAFWAV